MGAEEDVTGGWPCPGRHETQELLASQGYVTVSISANGINGQDWDAEDAGAQARSTLVRQYLARSTPSRCPAVRC